MNIIVVCCDSLRADAVNSVSTPNLMRIAEDGVRYTNAMSCGSITQLSMPYLLCGQPNFQVRKAIQWKMRELGYDSKLITTNYYPVYTDFWHGFRYKLYEPKIPILPVNKLKQSLGWWLDRYAPFALRRTLQQIYGIFFNLDIGYMPADKLLPLAESHLSDHDFMWVHLMDPHIPYRPKHQGHNPKYLDVINQKLLNAVWLRGRLTEKEVTQVKRLYRENVYEMDQAIGRFYDQVKENAVFVVTSDHGDEHGEDGQYGHHGDRVNDNIRHVPLIIAGHGRRGVRHESVTTDLLPHILLEIAK